MNDNLSYKCPNCGQDKSFCADAVNVTFRNVVITADGWDWSMSKSDGAELIDDAHFTCNDCNFNAPIVLFEPDRVISLTQNNMPDILACKFTDEDNRVLCFYDPQDDTFADGTFEFIPTNLLPVYWKMWENTTHQPVRIVNGDETVWSYGSNKILFLKIGDWTATLPSSI